MYSGKRWVQLRDTMLWSDNVPVNCRAQRRVDNEMFDMESIENTLYASFFGVCKSTVL